MKEHNLQQQNGGYQRHTSWSQQHFFRCVNHGLVLWYASAMETRQMSKTVQADIWWEMSCRQLSKAKLTNCKWTEILRLSRQRASSTKDQWNHCNRNRIQFTAGKRDNFLPATQLSHQGKRIGAVFSAAGYQKLNFAVKLELLPEADGNPATVWLHYRLTFSTVVDPLQNQTGN